MNANVETEAEEKTFKISFNFFFLAYKTNSAFCGEKKKNQGHSLAIQWLGLSAFTAVAKVQSLVRELRSHKLHGTAGKKKKSQAVQK